MPDRRLKSSGYRCEPQIWQLLRKGRGAGSSSFSTGANSGQATTVDSDGLLRITIVQTSETGRPTLAVSVFRSHRLRIQKLSSDIPGDLRPILNLAAEKRTPKQAEE